MNDLKWGVAIALPAGVVAAVYLVWAIGFGAVFAAIARAGFGGLALLCLYALVVFVALAVAWYFLLPPAQRRHCCDFYLARLVRDSIAEISPFSPVGGMVAAARLMILKGMDARLCRRLRRRRRHHRSHGAGGVPGLRPGLGHHPVPPSRRAAAR